MHEDTTSLMEPSLGARGAATTARYGNPLSAQPRPYLLLGIGNILLRDEGAGVRVVEALRQQDMPAEVEIFDGASFGLDLLEMVAGRRLVIVIDAIDVRGMSECYAPGTAMRLNLDDLRFCRRELLSLHDIGVLDMLAVARVLACASELVVVFGVVPKIVEEGLELSEELAAAVPEVTRLVRIELDRRMAEDASRAVWHPNTGPGAGLRSCVDLETLEEV